MSDDWPDRNEDRHWYDAGYSLGAVETRRDAAFPRLIGAWTLFGAVMWDPLVAGTYLAIYTAFTVQRWRDDRDSAADKREFYDPGPEWDWGDGGDGDE